tara:strand:+ start:291 stop:878 length:588 start_codon:yes stop_codon:yes gene_type:complete
MDYFSKAAISSLPEEAQKHASHIYDIVDDVYGINPVDLVNKKSILAGLSKLMYKQLIGEEPDELAKEVMKIASRHYYNPPAYITPREAREGYWEEKLIENKNNYAISLLEEYQKQYGIVTNKGVEIVKDMIRNNLLSRDYQEARKYIKSIESGTTVPSDDFNFKWDLGKGSSQPDILDVIHAIHGTDYNRQKADK